MSHCDELSRDGAARCCNGDCRQGRSCERSRQLTASLLLPPPTRRPGFWLALLAGLWTLVAGSG